MGRLPDGFFILSVGRDAAHDSPVTDATVDVVHNTVREGATSMDSGMTPSSRTALKKYQLL